jgi:hypothetical protein
MSTSTILSNREVEMRRQAATKKLTKLLRQIAKMKRLPRMPSLVVGWTDRVHHVPTRQSLSHLNEITPMRTLTINGVIIETNGEISLMLYKSDKETGFVLFIEETEVCLAMDIAEIVRYYATAYAADYENPVGLDKLTQVIERLEQLVS